MARQRGRPAPAAAASASIPLEALQLEEPGEVDMLLYHNSEFLHRVENAVHTAQRLEHRLQKQAAALPEGLRRLFAGRAGWCGRQDLHCSIVNGADAADARERPRGGGGGSGDLEAVWCPRILQV